MSRSLWLCVAALSVAGCGEKPGPTEKTADAASTTEKAAKGEGVPDQPDPVALEAKKIFTQRCVICHGAGGKGDGASAQALNPKPRDYTDAAWQDSVDDAALARAIVEGGAAVGKSSLMPPNPDLKSKPEVVSEIVKIIRSFKGKG